MKKIVLIICLMFLTCISSNVYADVISDINKQLTDISAEKKATANKISGLDKELSNYLYEILMLGGKIDIFSETIKGLEAKVDETTAKLNEQEQALQNSAQLYNSAEEIYITRLKVIYEKGIPNALDILLDSSGISDFFSKMNALKNILEYDKALVTNMKNQKEYIDHVKKNIEFQKTQLEQLKYDTEKSAQALEDARAAKESKVKEIETTKKNLKSKIDDLAKQEEEASKKLKAELAKIANHTGSFNGMFAWPVPGYSYISAGYGKYAPWGKVINHWGVDIAGSGIHGKPIVAAESGKVIKAVRNQSNSKTGYGNYVVIDHGKNVKDGANYRTLYGHASSVNVSVNQYVVKGQVIAYVGTTGNSTGPHLHFEVLKNGSNVNPIGYIK